MEANASACAERRKMGKQVCAHEWPGECMDGPDHLCVLDPHGEEVKHCCSCYEETTGGTDG